MADWWTATTSTPRERPGPTYYAIDQSTHIGTAVGQVVQQGPQTAGSILQQQNNELVQQCNTRQNTTNVSVALTTFIHAHNRNTQFR